MTFNKHTFINFESREIKGEIHHAMDYDSRISSRFEYR